MFVIQFLVHHSRIQPTNLTLQFISCELFIMSTKGETRVPLGDDFCLTLNQFRGETKIHIRKFETRPCKYTLFLQPSTGLRCLHAGSTHGSSYTTTTEVNLYYFDILNITCC